MKVNLAERTALVTGAARGLGQAMAAALAANGAQVVFADIDFAAAEQAAAASPGGWPLRFDVTSEAEVERGVEEILKRHGRLDILVNNAGVNTLAHRVNIDQFPTQEWDRILKVDLTGLFLVSRTVARQMIAQKSGRIINISSVLGLVQPGCKVPLWRPRPGSSISPARWPSNWVPRASW